MRSCRRSHLPAPEPTCCPSMKSSCGSPAWLGRTLTVGSGSSISPSGTGLSGSGSMDSRAFQEQSSTRLRPTGGSCDDATEPTRSHCPPTGPHHRGRGGPAALPGDRASGCIGSLRPPPASPQGRGTGFEGGPHANLPRRGAPSTGSISERSAASLISRPLRRGNHVSPRHKHFDALSFIYATGSRAAWGAVAAACRGTCPDSRNRASTCKVDASVNPPRG